MIEHLPNAGIPRLNSQYYKDYKVALFSFVSLLDSKLFRV